MKLTADDLAADIRRIDGNHDMGTGALAEALFDAGWSHIAGQQGAEDENALIKELAESAETLGRWSTLRSTDEATIDYWTDRVADLSRRLATRSPQPAKPADAVLPRYGFPDGIEDGTPLQPMSDGYWTPWHVADLVIAGLRKELDAREAAAGGVPAITESRVELAREAYYNAASVEDGCYTAPDAMCAALAAGGVARIDPAELLSAYVIRCIGHHDDAPRDYRIAAMREALEEMGVMHAAIPQQPTAEPAVDGLSLKSRPDFIAGYDAGVADEKLTQACNPAAEATGTVNGYLLTSRAVEIILDGSVPGWMWRNGEMARVTISPTGGKSDA